MIFLFFVEDSTLSKSATLSYGDRQMCKKNAFFVGRARRNSDIGRDVYSESIPGRPSEMDSWDYRTLELENTQSWSII